MNRKVRQQSFHFSRRDFLRLSAAATSLGLSSVTSAKSKQHNSRLGIYVNLSKNPVATISKIRDLGFDLKLALSCTTACILTKTNH